MGNGPPGLNVGHASFNAEDEGEMIYKVLHGGIVWEPVKGLDQLPFGEFFLLCRHRVLLATSYGIERARAEAVSAGGSLC
jgi:hypothetical protein